MALQDMFSEIQEETLKEIDDHKNRAKVEATKMLMAKGESLEKFYEEKKERLIEHLQKKEEMLKAEQDFTYRSAELKEKEQFYNELLIIFNKELLQYVDNNRVKYEKILELWTGKVINSMDTKVLTFKVNSKDVSVIGDITKKLAIDATIESDDTIQAGFLVFSNKGVKIDLTFKTLFNDQKQNLLSLSIRILKEGR